MKEKVIEIAKELSPLLAVALVACCALASLSGYEEPTYASESGDMSTDTSDDASGDASGDAAVQGNFDLEDGVYLGTANGYSGEITVSVQIQDKTIVAINIVSESDDEVYFTAAMAVIDTIIAAQSLDVDAVSGATYSSNGIIKAVRNALYGEEDTEEVGSASASTAVSGSSTSVSTVDESDAEYADGTYYGTGTGFSGDITVKVVISDGKITSITITDAADDSEYLNQAKAVITAIISGQTTNVDTVSGATYSSVGIITAVRNALAKAVTSSSSSSGSSSSSSAASDDSSGSSSSGSSSSTSITGTIPYDDGIYYGTAEGYGGDITVAVVIQDETIKAILVLDASGEDETFLSRAMTVVTNVVETQSTDVDAVSGATYSSNGLLNAIISALEDAARVTNGEEAQNNPYTSTDSSSDSSSDSDASDDEEEDDTVDTAALEKYINMAAALDESNYTEESWAALQEVLAEAQALLEILSGDMQEEADDMADSLYEAITSLAAQEDTTTYENGTYEVNVAVSPDEDEDFDAYNITFSITIFNDAIIEISYVSQDGDADNDKYIAYAVSGRTTSSASYTSVIMQILEAGGTIDVLNAYGTTDSAVDAVSRATCTSNAIVEACLEAFAQALAAKG